MYIYISIEWQTVKYIYTHICIYEKADKEAKFY